MDDVKLEIKGYYSVLNLHRALLEAKFYINPYNCEVAGSPIIAQICRDCTKVLIQHERATQGTDRWTEWLKLKNRPDYRERILDRMRDCPDWCKMDFDTKKIIASNYISPFTCTDAELDGLILEFESS